MAKKEPPKQAWTPIILQPQLTRAQWRAAEQVNRRDPRGGLVPPGTLPISLSPSLSVFDFALQRVHNKLSSCTVFLFDKDMCINCPLVKQWNCTVFLNDTFQFSQLSVMWLYRRERGRGEIVLLWQFCPILCPHPCQPLVNHRRRGWNCQPEEEISNHLVIAAHACSETCSRLHSTIFWIFLFPPFNHHSYTGHQSPPQIPVNNLLSTHCWPMKKFSVQRQWSEIIAIIARSAQNLK